MVERALAYPDLRSGVAIAPQHPLLIPLFTLLVVALTFFQKIALPLGDQGISIVEPLLIVCVACMVVFARASISPIRLLLFALFASCAFVSQIAAGRPFSFNSVALVISIYLPFIVYYPVSEETYLRCMKIFIGVMLFMGAIVLIQHLVQFTIGHRWWPNMNHLVPERFLLRQYAYDQAIQWGSRYFKPNAFFFLEVSILAQFTALALLIEIIYFQRILVILFFASILLLSFSGTGLVLMAVCAPFLLGRLSTRLVVTAALLAVTGLVVALGIGWYDQVSHRFTEYQRVDSSLYMRFINPIVEIQEFFRSPTLFLTGIGAGNMPVGKNVVWWAIVKVTMEYGIFTSIAFYMFFTYCLFGSANSKILAFAAFIFFNFLGGGFALPIYAHLCYVLCGLLSVQLPARARAQVRRPFALLSRETRPRPETPRIARAQGQA